MAPRCEAGRAVERWLDREGLTKTWLAGELGVANAVLWRWLAGERQPRVDFAAEIERLTGGVVPARMWQPKTRAA